MQCLLAHHLPASVSWGSEWLLVYDKTGAMQFCIRLDKSRCTDVSTTPLKKGTTLPPTEKAKDTDMADSEERWLCA